MGIFTDSKGRETRSSNHRGQWSREPYECDGKISDNIISNKYGQIEGSIDPRDGKVYDSYGKWTGEYYSD